MATAGLAGGCRPAGHESGGKAVQILAWKMLQSAIERQLYTVIAAASYISY